MTEGEAVRVKERVGVTVGVLVGEAEDVAVRDGVAVIESVGVGVVVFAGDWVEV